jgi:hypothetical protein
MAEAAETVVEQGDISAAAAEEAAAMAASAPAGADTATKRVKKPGSTSIWHLIRIRSDGNSFFFFIVIRNVYIKKTLKM